MHEERLHSKQIWLVDAAPHTRAAMAHGLVSAGWEVTQFPSLESALTSQGQERPALACVGVNTLSGLDEMERLRTTLPCLPCIVVFAPENSEIAEHALARGAYDCIPNGTDTKHLLRTVSRAAEHSWLRGRITQLERALAHERVSATLVGESRATRLVAEQVRQLLPSNDPVCVMGDSGTGKEAVARALHSGGARGNGTFVSVSCASIPKSLQESLLLGEEPAGLAGASERRLGRFDEAAGGTLYLDEVSELGLEAQATLLRAIQKGTFRRSGGTTERPFTARVVCASHRGLEQQVEAGRFREDLFLHLMRHAIKLAPLKDRKSDIPQLVGSFIRQLAGDVGRRVERISPDALDAIMAYDWPGNVRELRNIVHRAMLSADTSEITLAQLPRSIQLTHQVATTGVVQTAPRPHTQPDPEVLNLRELERRAIQRALETSGGCVSHAAKLLGIGRATIYRKLAAFDMRSQASAGDLS
ncbi:MAG: sigma-54 dependent transcriptional regulator [Polyangiaceae bacterium]